MPVDVFLAGVSRSGSTALAMLLGTHPRVAVIGESWQLADRWHSGKPCSCGLPLSECPFWRPVSDRVPLATFGPERAGELRAAIRELHGPSVVVDSSKKADYLRRVVPPDGVLVHLVRDPRGLVYSRYRGFSTDRREGVPGALDAARTSVDWSRRNAAAHLLARQRGGTTLRYEDFVEDAYPHARRILAAAGLDDDALGEGTQVQHIAAGNPVRMSTGQRVIIRPDVEWHTRLPRRTQLVSYLAALPMSAVYRYPVAQSARPVDAGETVAAPAEAQPL
jgi:hypothetical protein